MDGRQQRPQRKTLQWQLAQEQGHQSPPHGPSATSSQPDTKSNPQEDLQTQDWVCEPPARRRPGSRWNISIDERRRLAMLHAQDRANTAKAPSRDILGLHLSVRSTVPSPLTGSAPTSPNQVPETMVGHSQDIEQMVAELVSEGVDRDVLLPHPQHSTMYHNTFQSFLAQATPPLAEREFRGPDLKVTTLLRRIPAYPSVRVQCLSLSPHDFHTPCALCGCDPSTKGKQVKTKVSELRRAAPPGNLVGN